MPTRDTAWPAGTPCWVDYGAVDIEAAKTFYADLFGWTYTGGEPEYGGYRDAGQCSALQGGGEGPRWEGRQGPSSALDRAVLLLDVLRTTSAVRRRRSRRSTSPTRACWPGSSGGRGRGTPAASAATGHALEAVDQLGQGDLGWEVDEQVDVVVLAVELDQLGLEVGAHRPHDLLHPGQVPVAEHLVPVFRHENQVSVQGENAVSASADVCRVRP